MQTFASAAGSVGGEGGGGPRPILAPSAPITQDWHLLGSRFSVATLAFSEHLYILSSHLMLSAPPPSRFLGASMS